MILNLLLKTALIFLSICSVSCAKYQIGQGQRTFPGGYDRIAIPIFSNKTSEVGVETNFTEALRLEFERSKLANITSKNEAQVIIEGAIDDIKIEAVVPVVAGSRDISSPRITTNSENTNPLPAGTLLNKEYRITVSITVVARKVADASELWRGSFSNQQKYFAPLLGTPGISNSSPIYNQHYRVSAIGSLAGEMMSEAHDRLTENF